MKSVSYMFGPITTAMFDASERKTLLGCQKKKGERKLVRFFLGHEDI